MENRIVRMMNNGAPMNIAMGLLAKTKKKKIPLKAKAIAKKPDIRLGLASGFMNT
jgi:hypothetical protein